MERETWVDAASELLRTGRYEQGRIRWRLLEGDARETLLDVFRDAADFWAEKKVPFRVFYSFQ